MGSKGIARKFKQGEVSGGLSRRMDDKGEVINNRVALADTPGRLERLKPLVEGHTHPLLADSAPQVSQSSEHEHHAVKGFHAQHGDKV